MSPVYVDKAQVSNQTSKSTKTDGTQSQVISHAEGVLDCELPPYSETEGSPYHPEEATSEVPRFSPDTKSDFRRLAKDFPAAELEASLGTALQLAAENYFRGGAFEKAMSETIHRVATIQTTFHYGGSDESNFDNEETDAAMNRRTSTADLDIGHYGSKHASASHTRVCHKTSATGTLFGTIWLRTTSVQVNSHTGKDVDIISSFTFFPSWWLMKFGLN